MRLLIWLWERTGTEFCVTDGQWDWDEWHSLVYGYHETKPLPPPDYVLKEPHYYQIGGDWGRRLRMAGDCGCFLLTSLLFLAGLLAITNAIPYLVCKFLLEHSA